MASDQSMTLTRTSKSLPPVAMSKATRQVVPAFLQKLYEMVNDPKNSDLIQWSETGDSFYVLDHERFAHDVLGRWFKHRNFSSFVRQLNMYGFHKIPHLQQGVLKSDTETEYWNFAHPNFHRGQPDLLCLIQRKKTSNQDNKPDDIEVRDSTPTTTASVGANQVLDVQSIVNGIAAVKRHQTTISSELNELKRNNQLLWQEAMHAREKHQKQQDTINRIVKFLAGVFGNNVNRPKDTSGNSPGVVVPRRTSRLMIEDAIPGGESIVELDDDDMATPLSMASFDDPRSPSEKPTPPPHRPSEHPTPAPQLHAVPDRSVASRSPPVFDVDPRVANLLSSLSQAQVSQLVQSLALQSQNMGPQVPPPNQPSSNLPNPNPGSAPSNTQPNSYLTPYTPPIDFSFANMMQTPGAGPSTAPGSSTTNPPLFSNVHAQSPLFTPAPTPHGPTSTEGLISFDDGTPNPGALSASTFSPFDTETLYGQWQQAEDIDRDVNVLEGGIKSLQQLITKFGLDPNLMNPPGTSTSSTTASSSSSLPQTSNSTSANTNYTTPGPSISTPAPTPNVDSSAPQGNSTGLPSDGLGGSLSSNDFDFETFFNTLPTMPVMGGLEGMDMSDMGMDFVNGSAADYTNVNPGANGDSTANVDYVNDAQAGAFLDEVPSPATVGTSPAMSLRQVSPEVSTGRANATATYNTLNAAPSTGGAASRKRKSDVSEIDRVNAMEFESGLGHFQVTPTNDTTTGAGSGAAGRPKRRKER